jgi:LuxR family maltose regulon positive regulatory protein
LKLGRLRSQGKCVEFGTEELGFTEEEASAVLAGAGAHLPRDAVAALVRRTEGWPAGVYLAALSVHGTVDEAAAAAAGIAGTDKFIGDYFREEVLVRESAETVRFLLRTAVLDEMSGPLCDAVLGQTGSATWLVEIESRNLFVVPQDHDGQWYRYHWLFGEMLLAELRRREPGEELRIHRRAAVWYEEHGYPERAIKHALAGHDTPAAARLVTTYGQQFVNAGRIYTVRGWLEDLDGGALDEHPAFAVIAGWIWALTGDSARAQRCLLAAEQGPHDAAPLVGSVSLNSSIAMLRAALAPFGVERMLVDARRAFEVEPPGGPWYPLAGLLVGEALLLNGAPEAAAKAWERAAYFGRERQPSAASVALAQLSLLAAERGDWGAARDYAAEAWALIEAAGLPDYLASIVAYIARARVAAHNGDIAGARHHAGRALRLYASPSPAAFPWLATQTAILLGRILLDLDDHPAARLKVSEAGRHLNRLLTEGVLRDQHRRLAADLARHGGWPRVPSAMTLTAAELRVLDLLPTHLTLGEIADELHISRNTVKSQVAAVYRKLRAATRTEAVREGRNVGLIEP